MSYLTITNITVSNPNASLKTPVNIMVRFECLKQLKCNVEWKAIFVDNPDNIEFDQVLDVIQMEGVDYGVSEFDWELEAPNYAKLESEFDIFDTSVIMILVYVDGKEFFRCSYLTTHIYTNPIYEEEPPESVKWDEVERRVNVKRPIIAVSDVDWKSIE